MPRILVINPNSSVVATSHIEKGVRSVASAETVMDVVTAPLGAEAIDTPLDVAIAAIETGKMVAERHKEYDAFIVAAGDDPGLELARQLTDKPVVGIAEAGLLFACTLGARIGVLTALRNEIPRTWDLIRKYGLTTRTASVRALEKPSATNFASSGLIAEPMDLLDQFEAEANDAVADDRAEVIVVIGSVACAIAQSLGQRTGVPVLSGTLCAVKLAESLVHLGARTSRTYAFRTPTKQDRLIGYSEFSEFYSSPPGPHW